MIKRAASNKTLRYNVNINMTYKLKKLLCNLGPTKKLRRYFRHKFLHLPQYNSPVKAYSQEGEDLILKKYFGSRKKNGFYVDIGAHHPFRFSNTALLREMGWTGINIEPSPDLIENFYKFRPDDINLNIGVSLNKGMLNYYKFNEQLINTFSEELAFSRVGTNGWEIEEKILIETKTLSQILKESINENQIIDVFSIDTEGFDYEVLVSNDWTMFRPEIIVVEIYDELFVKNILSSEICLYLEDKEYSFFAKTVNSVFFMDRKRLA